MATLKGQNFRILTKNNNGKYSVIGMSTSCSISRQANSESQSTKDDVGMFDKPIVLSKSWSVSCESLNVVDAALMLTTIKAMQPVTLMWDEVSTTDNQTPLSAGFARQGQAYLNDLTLTFDNRTTSAKSLQFQGSGPLTAVTTAPTIEAVAPGAYSKGENVRLFISSDNTSTPAAVVAAARSLSVHVSLQLENSTTKDTDGDYDVQEPTGITFDITSGALVRSGDTITSSVGAKTYADIVAIHEASAPVKFEIANVSGANHRTKGSVIMSGSVVVTQLESNNPNRADSEYTTTCTGYGEYTVGAAA